VEIATLPKEYFVVDVSQKVPAYQMALDSRVVKHFNEINPAWLFTGNESGLNIIILHTDKKTRSIIREKTRFMKTLRKIYGKQSSHDRMTRLFIWLVSGSNSVDVVENFRKQLLKSIIESDSTNYSWFAPAGFDRGIINGR